jgi:hypothetical protein
VAELEPLTEQGTPELVLALEQASKAGAGTWIRARLPVSNETGWIEGRQLGPLFEVNTALDVDRRAFTATLLKDGRAIWSAPIGLGKPEWPTPAGRSYVRQRLVPARPTGLYGAFVFGTSAHVAAAPWPGATLVAIHGTNRPERIPGLVSRGCVRMRNEDILELRELMPLGTPVRIV